MTRRFLRRGRRSVALLAATALAIPVGVAVVGSAPAQAAISIDTSTYYVIVNANSGKALDLWEWSTADGGEFRQFTRGDGWNQQFQFVSSGDGYYRLKNRHSGKVVDVWGWSTEDGGEINQYTDLNGANQQWMLTGGSNSTVRFLNRNSGKALEVFEWSLDDGGDIAQWTDYSNANQTWQLIAVDGASSGGPEGWASQNGGTTGGGSGPVVNVSTLSAFSSAINSSTAQTVRLTSNISCSGMLSVNSNKTIIGSGGGPTITGCGLTISGKSNIIIRNLNFTGMSDDGINVQDGSTNIWIDHNEFSNGYDGCVDIRLASDFVTVSWNKFSNHDKTMLLGSSDSNTGDRGHLRVSYHHNWFAGTSQRHPRVRFGNPVHVYSNYYASISYYGVASTMEAGVLVEGNYFENTNDPFHLGEGSSPEGSLVARNNYFSNSGSGEQGGSVNSIPYSYTLDTPSSVKSIVTGGAGSTLGL